MKKLLISLGLVFLLVSPVYADTHTETATVSEGGATDAAGLSDDSDSEEDVADVPSDSSILQECSAWQTFQEETDRDNSNSCRKSILEQLGNNPDLTPRHAFFNNQGSEDFSIGEESVTGCCYQNRHGINYDENNDCILDTSAEECQLEQAALEIKKACICAENPEHEICSQVFRCQAEQSSPTAYSTDGPIPFQSEFFDVTDPNKGLLAEDQSGSLVAGSDNDQGPIFAVVNRALNIIVGLASTVALVILIIGAYMLITSQGGENQMEKGKNAIIYSLVGLAFVLMSFTIVRLVQSILF